VYPATCGLGAAAARAASTEVVKMALVNMLIMLQRVCDARKRAGTAAENIYSRSRPSSSLRAIDVAYTSTTTIALATSGAMIS
jgi:hypothetical protein